MNQEIKNRLEALSVKANEICCELWDIQDDESLTKEEKDEIGSYAIDADELSSKLKPIYYAKG